MIIRLDDRLRGIAALVVWETPAVHLAEISVAVSARLENYADLSPDSASASSNVADYRRVVRSFGFDVGRYRISSDALRRRLLARKSIATGIAGVDLANLISVALGFPIGCYDRGQIEQPVDHRVGVSNETIASMAKGSLGVVGLPVLADRVGIFGSCVSDSFRTSISPKSCSILFAMYCSAAFDEAKTFGTIFSVYRDAEVPYSSEVAVFR